MKLLLAAPLAALGLLALPQVPPRPTTSQAAGTDGDKTVILRSNERYTMSEGEMLIAKEIWKGDADTGLNALNPGVTFDYIKFGGETTRWTLLFENVVIGEGNTPYIYSHQSWQYGAEFRGPGAIWLQELNANGEPVLREESDTIVFISVPYNN